jgi:hypothetical protein
VAASCSVVWGFGFRRIGLWARPRAGALGAWRLAAPSLCPEKSGPGLCCRLCFLPRPPKFPGVAMESCLPLAHAGPSPMDAHAHAHAHALALGTGLPLAATHPGLNAILCVQKMPLLGMARLGTRSPRPAAWTPVPLGSCKMGSPLKSKEGALEMRLQQRPVASSCWRCAPLLGANAVWTWEAV